MTLTLKLVLRTSALQQRQVTHNVLQLHRVQRPGQCGCLQRAGAAFDQLQPCRETETKGQNCHNASHVSPTTCWIRMPHSQTDQWCVVSSSTKGQINRQSRFRLIQRLLYFRGRAVFLQVLLSGFIHSLCTNVSTLSHFVNGEEKYMI